MRFLKPSGEYTAETIVPVDSPDAQVRIALLEAELAKALAQPVRVVENVVEKVVEKFVEDKDMLSRLNATLRENAELKKFQGPIRVVEKIVEVEVEKRVEIKTTEKIINYWLLAGCGVLGSLIGFIVGRIR